LEDAAGDRGEGSAQTLAQATSGTVVDVSGDLF
jgi:hypothetical protein